MKVRRPHKSMDQCAYNDKSAELKYNKHQRNSTVSAHAEGTSMRIICCSFHEGASIRARVK